MTDITMVRGDRRTSQFTITNTAVTPNVPVNLTGAVARLAVKQQPDDDDDDALILLRSYFPEEVSFTDLVNGVGYFDILPWRTRAIDPGCYFWDFEVVRPRESVTAVGTLAVTAGSKVIAVTGGVFTAVWPGDILVPAGGSPANTKRLVITAVGGKGAADDPGAGNLLTDYDGWDDEAGVAFEVFRGDVKTTDSGNFILQPDGVRG